MGVSHSYGRVSDSTDHTVSTLVCVYKRTGYEYMLEMFVKKMGVSH